MLELIRIYTFEGPNRYRPQAGVYFQLQADQQIKTQLSDTLKDAAQRVGLILAYLTIEVAPIADHYLVSVQFTTLTPALGAEISHYTLRLLANPEADDWDPEEQLWQLQRRRRAEALPLWALQTQAEAQRRGIYSYIHQTPTRTLQIGTGAKAIFLACEAISTNIQFIASGGAAIPPPTVDWDQVGNADLIVLSGSAATEAIPHIQQTITTPFAIGHGDLIATRTALADPAADTILLALEAQTIEMSGLPFDVCDCSVIIGLAALANRQEAAMIAGLPLLVTKPTGYAVLDADTPEILALAEYANCRLIFCTTGQILPTSNSDQAIVCSKDGLVYGDYAKQRFFLGRLNQGQASMPQLAAYAVIWGAALVWE